MYDLVVRMRELIDEHLHTSEGAARLHAEITRRQEKAKQMLKEAEARVRVIRYTAVFCSHTAR